VGGAGRGGRPSAGGVGTRGWSTGRLRGRLCHSAASPALGGRTAWASRGCPEAKATSFRGHSKPRPTARMRFTAASFRISWTNQITNALRGAERGGEETGVPRILGACLQSRRPKKPIGRWTWMSFLAASREPKKPQRKLCWMAMGFGCPPMAIGAAATMTAPVACDLAIAPTVFLTVVDPALKANGV